MSRMEKRGRRARRRRAGTNKGGGARACGGWRLTRPLLVPVERAHKHAPSLLECAHSMPVGAEATLA